MKRKPCPFCGQPKPIRVAEWNPGKGIDGEDTFRVRCTDCGAEGPWASHGLTADELWNRREARK
jgi:Lar family restriction alleviation protein